MKVLVVGTFGTFAALVAAMSIVTCGGNSLVECAAGTAPVSGVCVVAEAGASDGTSAESAETEASGGGNGNSDGDALDSAMAVDAGDESPAVDGPSEDASPDDPCPTGAYVNCSTSCGGPSGGCENLLCPNPTFTTISDPSQLPFVARTPSHPGAPMACEQTCQGKLASLMAWSFGLNLPPSSALRVEVGAPWHIGTGVPCRVLGTDAALPPTGCAEFSQATFLTLTIWTDDPDAPARNILVSEVDAGQRCP